MLYVPMVLKNFTIIRFIPLLYGTIWDNVFLREGGVPDHSSKKGNKNNDLSIWN